MEDKISLVIPCCNVENYIERCLQSIENQTYIQNGMGEFEIILIDDASTDRTYEQLLKFERKYPENVLLISCESNCGPATARNTALKYATGAYISFIDADDVTDATMLSRMYGMMRLHDVDIVECSYRIFSDIDELSEHNFVQKNGSDHLLKIETPKDRGDFILNSFKTAVWGRLYKKSFLDDNALYFPDNMIYGEDNFFSGLAMLMCKSYYYISGTLYYYYNNANGIIKRNNDNERIRQLADVMKLYINELDVRGFLDGTLAGYAAEFEWYMIYKYFMDPVSFVISRRVSDWRRQSGYFGKELLKFFPDAYNNVYLNSDKRWADYITLLKEAETASHN